MDDMAARGAGTPGRRRARRPVVDVRDHGAAGDGVQLDSHALQRAVDEASTRQGTVRVPTGRYRVGTVELRDDVTVVLEADAVLLGSRSDDDFFPLERLPYETHADHETSDFRNGLLVGDDLQGIVITGDGTIDMQRDARFGPKPIALRRCEGVEVSGITIRNAPNYCVSLGACDDVLVEAVTIRDAFSDGIDPDSCRNVRIVGCDVESDDDALCIKTSLILGAPRACDDVVVRDCRLNSPSNGFKIGTETSGDVRNVDVKRCVIDGTPRAGADPAGLVLAHEGGGVAIESVDGAHVSNVRVADVEIDACDVPIFIRLGARGRAQPTPVPGSIRDVVIRDVRARRATDACTISGVAGHAVERVTLENIGLQVAPAVPPPRGSVPERDAEYPQAGMFGPLPAAGIYARHAVDLLLRDVEVAVDDRDTRPWLVTEDVIGLVVEHERGDRGAESA
jgi:polygalacturonase